MSKFIHIYKDALSAEYCNRCIEKFEHSQNKNTGRTGQGIDLKKKNSTDITLNSFQDEWQKETAFLQKTVLDHLVDYVRHHPFLLAGAVALQIKDANGIKRDLLHSDIQGLDDQAIANMLMGVYRLGSINLQKYDRNKGGYFHWHSEHYPHPNDPQNDSLHRVLLWMFYLNDVDEGGETEFFYQQATVKPVKGTMVIAPAGFSHTHRGAMPVSGDKYIFTSWLQYQPADKLYGQH